MNDSDSAKTIPKVLYQTYSDFERIPAHIHKKRQIFVEQRGYRYEFYNDEMCEAFLGQEFGDHAAQVFLSLSGAHRADLWRYAVLLRRGGVYADVKTLFTRPIDEIVDHAPHVLTTAICRKDPKSPLCVYQGFVACARDHPLIRKLLENMLSRSSEMMANESVAARPAYHAFVRDFALNLMSRLRLTKLEPGTFTEPGRRWKYVLLAERCGGPRGESDVVCQTPHPDRHGLCCELQTGGERMLIVRDHTYPFARTPRRKQPTQMARQDKPPKSIAGLYICAALGVIVLILALYLALKNVRYLNKWRSRASPWPECSQGAVTRRM